MHHFIDRRANPKGKSLGNRQRFLRRARENIKERVDRSVREKSIGKGDSVPKDGEKVTIPGKGLKEPRFFHGKGGNRRYVLPGNKDFVVGDTLDRPKNGQGEGGRKGSDDGEGDDAFSFTLTRDEYLEILFDGVAVPDLVEKSTVETETVGTRRAGLTTAGPPITSTLCAPCAILWGAGSHCSDPRRLHKKSSRRRWPNLRKSKRVPPVRKNCWRP